jgi:hypothetical protein
MVSYLIKTNLLSPSWTLKLESAISAEILESFYLTTKGDIEEGCDFNIHLHNKPTKKWMLLERSEAASVV